MWPEKKIDYIAFVYNMPPPQKKNLGAEKSGEKKLVHCIHR